MFLFISLSRVVCKILLVSTFWWIIWFPVIILLQSQQLILLSPKLLRKYSNAHSTCTCATACCKMGVPSCHSIALVLIQNNGLVGFLLDFSLNHFYRSKTCAFTLSLILYFAVVSRGENDTTVHFTMISALRCGIFFWFYTDFGVFLFSASSFCSLKVWCNNSLFT